MVFQGGGLHEKHIVSPILQHAFYSLEIVLCVGRWVIVVHQVKGQAVDGLVGFGQQIIRTTAVDGAKLDLLLATQILQVAYAAFHIGTGQKRS